MRDKAAVLAWTTTSLAVLSAVCIPVAASLWVADSVAAAFFQQPDDVAQVSGVAPFVLCGCMAMRSKSWDWSRVRRLLKLAGSAAVVHGQVWVLWCDDDHNRGL